MGPGDVVGDTASVDQEIVVFDGLTGKIIESANTTDSTITHFLQDATLVLLDANNDGNPFIRHGSSATDALQTNIAYDTGAQTLDYVNFATATTNAAADKGEIRFAVDAGNGMAGIIVPLAFKNLPCKIFPLYFELDGTFPNHEANPIKPENVADLRTEVLQEKADIGIPISTPTKAIQKPGE